MANQEHIDKLRQGIKIWNAWKWHAEGHSTTDIGAILSDLKDPHIDLQNANLSNMQLSDADLGGVNLRNANLSNTNLQNADLRSADLLGADLSNADLRNAKLRYANLNNANLQDADLRNANLRYIQLKDANLDGASFSYCDLQSTDLSGLDFHNATLIYADLYTANLQDANLSELDLSNTDLRQTNLSGINLSNAMLASANLSNANLSNASLFAANLSNANLGGANLHNADLRQAKVDATQFDTIDLRTTKGLETIEHFGPSTIGIDTIILSHGKIPEIFLRKAGIPSSIIEQIPALIGSLEPIQYYTCFISYSSYDQDFAERLYADLQSKGVRCWYAPHDLRIGDRFADRIEESIRTYDKLLIVLSENSLKSTWVEDECRAALEKENRFRKEQQLDKTVLFPIKLDETIEEATTQWVCKIRRERQIGDFTCWKDYDAYQKAFARLLRDLKAET